MSDHPIDAIILDAAPVAKSDVRDYVRARARLRADDADWVRARDLTGTFGVELAGANFDLDPDDTTSADDGTNIIVDDAGNRFARVSRSLSDPDKSQRIVTAAGAVSMIAADDIILVNKTVGEATTVNLLTAAGRTRSITIKDLKGDAATNAITIDPAGVETIDGLSTWVISFNGGAVTLYPLGSGTGWFIL